MQPVAKACCDITQEVIPAPRGRLIRRSLGTMKGCVVARRYRIVDTIGAGGMGSVYEAIDLQTGSEVALKALQPGAYDPIRLKRLRREARMMTAVRSAHVCNVHYLGVERGTPFIVMERLQGCTLRSRLLDEGALPVGEAVAIACQLLDALGATHEAGIIHRDVKPSNVFLTPNESGIPHVTLIDFGLAKVVRHGEVPASDSAFDADLSCAEAISGTLHFLAPEQLLSADDLDERVDVYAVGVTLFEMLAGHRAFSGTYSEVVHKIVIDDPPLVRDTRPEVPAILDDILSMALAKSRDRRFASVHAFKRALLAVAEDYHLDLLPQRPMVKASGVFERREEHEHHHDLTFEDEELPTLRPPPSVGVKVLGTLPRPSQVPVFEAWEPEPELELTMDSEVPKPPSSGVVACHRDVRVGEELPTVRPPAMYELDTGS